MKRMTMKYCTRSFQDLSMPHLHNTMFCLCNPDISTAISMVPAAVSIRMTKLRKDEQTCIAPCRATGRICKVFYYSPFIEVYEGGIDGWKGFVRLGT